MSLSGEFLRVVELFQLPFMQRAMIGGVLSGLMGGMLGSITTLRQLSFFSDALGHSMLLGISLGVIMGWNLTAIVLPFSVLFALGVTYLLEKTQIWTDALLNIIYSSSLAIAVIILSFTDTYKGGLETLLFGDILGFRQMDLYLSLGLFVICALFLSLTLRTQMLITVNEPLAIARGVTVTWHRTLFIVLLSLVVGVAIKAIGVLLISAFVVIPACASQLICRKFTHHVLMSAGLGGISAVIGMLLSAALNLPSGPSIVVTQLGIFLAAIILPKSQQRMLA